MITRRSSFRRFNDGPPNLKLGNAGLVMRSVPMPMLRNAKKEMVWRRGQLLKTLHDHDAGKLDHLDHLEQGHFVASVEKRIADLSKQIARLEETQDAKGVAGTKPTNAAAAREAAITSLIDRTASLGPSIPLEGPFAYHPLKCSAQKE